MWWGVGMKKNQLNYVIILKLKLSISSWNSCTNTRNLWNQDESAEAKRKGLWEKANFSTNKIQIWKCKMSKSFSMSRHNKHSMRQLKNFNNKKRWKWKMTTIRPTRTLVSFDLCSFASVRTLKTLTRLFDTSSNWKCKRVQNISVPLNLLFSPSWSLFMPSHALPIEAKARRHCRRYFDFIHNFR